ncbi:succinate dehydrogenase membrane subunit SdhD1 domain protein [Mycobacterium xenopi 4042]|uniref:Succinate dehydrogenase membrane subunit SdhD1 domain protein n=1 Tax=Mycobacterium xenopi 4042 TaxID=1299334 RepID=X7ZC54_MYCXE|nr:succinate dehydrogenase membrane subunit SdhD1 domain protein [Mycobacterium xenopi 4042]
MWTDLGLSVFVIYATIRAFWGSAYYVEDYHYLTPFYSPCVSASCVEGAGTLAPGLANCHGSFRWRSYRCRFCWRSG